MKFLATGRTRHEHAADMARESQLLTALRALLLAIISHGVDVEMQDPSQQ
jgi:hypothetical protein